MLIGDPSTFAIESEVAEAYDQVSVRALGYFVLHVGGAAYGIREASRTCMALPVEGVRNRLSRRGKHIAPFAPSAKAADVANCMIGVAGLAPEPKWHLIGMDGKEVLEVDRTSHLVNWTLQYGDQAFDDGSIIVLLDVGQKIRLVAFRNGDAYQFEPGSLRDVWLPSEVFYDVLAEWLFRFENQLAAMTKKPFTRFRLFSAGGENGLPGP